MITRTAAGLLLAFGVSCTTEESNPLFGGDASSGNTGGGDVVGGGGNPPTGGGNEGGSGAGIPGVAPDSVRVAHFNIWEFSTDKIVSKSTTSDKAKQRDAAAAIVARFNPDIIEFNEFQYDIEGEPTGTMPGAPASESEPGMFFAQKLSDDEAKGTAQNARRMAEKIQSFNGEAVYSYSLQTLGNSGFFWEGDNPNAPASGYQFDLRGWGEFPGRHNTAILSRFPIITEGVRIIHDFKWEDLPDHHIAEAEAASKTEYGTDTTVPEGFPLFEKSLNIVPLDLGSGETLYLVLLHTVAPGWDAINAFRNYDELRGLTLFLRGELPGVEPLPEGAKFIVMGDLNADKDDESGAGNLDHAIKQITDLETVRTYYPAGAGTKGTDGKYNSYASQCGIGKDNFNPTNVANMWQMQLDYILPSTSLGAPTEGAVFWPNPSSEAEDWMLSCKASDHRFLFADIPLKP